MIGIGSYKNFNLGDWRLISVSSDGGATVGFNGERCTQLVPSRELMDEWNSHKFCCDPNVLERIFVRKYYEQNLHSLDAEELYQKLNSRIVVDYEDSPVGDIIAEWLNILLGVKTSGISNIDLECVLFEREPNENIRVSLEEIMREKVEEVFKSEATQRGLDSNKYKFQSLQAAYLYMKSLECEKKGQEQAACFLRCDADEAEEKYLRGEVSEQTSTLKWVENASVQDMWLEEQGHVLCYNPKTIVLKKQHKELDGQLRFY